MFWSGDKLSTKLDELVQCSEGRSAKIDCAAIELSVGTEVYVTPSSKDDSSAGVKKVLDDKKSQFTIPSGQFSFILTDEIVNVPSNAIAFISFKATYKFKGLVNVSGFHVDPGWKGKLIFSLYNAGPNDITLEHGDSFALIWFSDLDCDSSVGYRKNISNPNVKLTSSLISGMSIPVVSPHVLEKEMKDLRSELKGMNDRVSNRMQLSLLFFFSSILIISLRHNVDDIFSVLQKLFSFLIEYINNVLS